MLRRYAKLYVTSISRSIQSRMEYKSDLLVALFGFIFQNLCSILSIFFIVSSIPELNVPGQGVWNIWQIGFLYGFTMIPKGIDHLFSDELWLVAYKRVTDGTLDMHFLRPVPVLFSVIAETFQPEGFSEIIVGTIMLLVCAFQPSVNIVWSVGSVVLMIVASIFGALIITSMKIFIAALAFKIKRSGQILQIIYNCLTYVKYPKNIYPVFIRIILISIIPFAIIISIPAEIFLGFNAFNPWLLSLIIIGISAIFLTISIIIWTICASKYESTGN